MPRSARRRRCRAGEQIRRCATEEHGEPGCAEGLDAATDKMSPGFKLEPFALEGEWHVRQIPHGRMLTAMVRAKLVVAGRV
jgi:hypothetical protein